MLNAAALRSTIAVAVAIVAAGPAGAQVRPTPRAVAERDAGADVTELDVAFDVERGLPGETAVLRARLRDARGRPADAPLLVEADGGTVEVPERVGPGHYIARVALPTVLGARRALLVHAAAGRSAASASLPLGPGPAASLRVESMGELPADGADHALWVGVSDEHGNPSVEAPRARARRGSVGAPVALASGGWMISYRPPRDTRGGEDVVHIEAGPASVSKTLRLVPMAPALSLSARGGVVAGTGDPAPAVAAEVAGWLPRGGVDLGLQLGAAAWRTDRRSTVAGPAGDLVLEARRAWVPVTVAAASRLGLGRRAVATFSLGGGAALVTSRTELAGEAAVSEVGWALAATAGLELALRLRAGEPFLAVQAFWLGDPHLDTLRGMAWPVAAYLGYRFHAL